MSELKKTLEESKVVFYEQDQSNPQGAFKSRLLDVMFNQLKSDYILFGVDDIMVTREVDVQARAQVVEKHNTYSFMFDIEKVYAFKNNAPHTHYIPEFIQNERLIAINGSA